MDLSDEYNGAYDRVSQEEKEWFESMEPWFPQPTSTTGTTPNDIWNTDFVDDYKNSWQADWFMTFAVVEIEFIDWGNPLENINPRVGKRFPVELALFTLVEEMLAYNMACLEYPASKNELFGT